MLQSGTLSSQSNEETGDDGRESAGNCASVDRKISGIVAQDATGNATGSLDRVAQEGGATFLLNGLVELDLATQKRAVRGARSVGDGRHELSVFIEDVAGTGLAQLLSWKRGLNAKQKKVFALELFQVGDDHLLLAAARILGSERQPKIVGGRGFFRAGGEEVLAGFQCGSNFKNAVVSAVGFGADSPGKRVEDVKDIVSAEHIGVGGGDKFVAAGVREFGELATNDVLGAS